MEAFGEVLRRLRMSRGLSVRQLADLVPYSRSQITALENGRRRANADTARVFEEALGAPGLFGDAVAERLDMDSEALRVAMEWLVGEPPQVRHLRAGRRIGAELVDNLAARVHELRLLDDRLGGRDTMALVSAELRQTLRVVRDASYTEQLGARLHTTLAELWQLAGWTASDAGEYATAERCYLDGVRAATEGRAIAEGANLLSCLSYQIANVGRPSDAVLLARAAVRGADSVTGRTRALLLDRLAWAYARAGERNECDRTLALVDEALDDAGDDDPIWTYWVDAIETSVMAGRCYVELRRPLRAVPTLSAAIASYPTERARETALYRTWLAEAYAQANEMDAACDVLRVAAELADPVNSERLRSRIRSVSSRLAA